MSARYPVMVLGGYGAFGRRVCRRLARDPRFRVIIAGRSRDKAQRHVANLLAEFPDTESEGRAVLLPDGLAGALEDSGAGAVIHCAGPFQGQDYRVPEICIEAGVHYLDLADDREFVAEFATLDEPARQNDVIAISGASSVPGTSSAMVDVLAPGFTRLRTIEIGIASGNRAPRGPGVTAGILSYVGKPIPRWQDGAWHSVHGWQDLRRRNIVHSDGETLGTRWFAACDVPDAVLLPERYPGVETVTFHAGLELPLLHLGLYGLSWLVRCRALPSLRPCARPFGNVADLFRPFGSDRGGMFVTVGGEGPDGPLRRTAGLIAATGQGPWVPCLPAVILARKIAEGALTDAGARACLGAFTFEELAEEARDLDVAFEIA